MAREMGIAAFVCSLLAACTSEPGPDRCHLPLPERCKNGVCVPPTAAEALAELCMRDPRAISSPNDCGGRSVSNGAGYLGETLHYDAEDRFLGYVSWTDLGPSCDGGPPVVGMRCIQVDGGIERCTDAASEP